MPRFWDLRGHLTEGRAWLGELLNVADASLPIWLKAKALKAAA